MSGIDNNSTALQRVLSDYSMAKQQEEQRKADNSKDLGKDEFMKLLVAQLENQDPTNPQKNGEFIAQLAQFSQLQETQKMSESMEGVTSAFQSAQHLQATSLVGRPVHVESQETLLTDEGAVSVVADMPQASSNATLSVYNEAGEQVDNYDLGQQPAGQNEFLWSGMKTEDERFPPGMYRFEVKAADGNEMTDVQTYLSANVNSVTIEPEGGLTLNLAGIGARSMDEVIQIN